MTRLVIDSTCDLPAEFVREHGITVLPLHILAEEQEYLDRVTITTRQIYNLMRKGVLPGTAQVNVVDTYRTLEKLLQSGDDVLCLLFSSKMSGTCALVEGIAQKLQEAYPKRKIKALDSRSGSFATGLIAMEAANMAGNGADFDALAERCRVLIDHVEHVFVISDLSWLVRGGRVSRTMGYTANLLDIKPVLDVKNGEIEVIQKVRGRLRSMHRVVEITAERIGNRTGQVIGIAHADDREAAEKLRDMLAERLPSCSFLIEEIGAVLAVHLGIGGVGVFFFRGD